MSYVDGKPASERDAGPKKVMVRLSRSTVDRIDDYAGNTHSSRPDFITDAVRQYGIHVLRESVQVISRVDVLDVSKQAKEVYYTQQMSERLYREMDAYRKSREGTQRSQDVSILVTMPAGLHGMIADIVAVTGIFSGIQEFIKVSVHHMFWQMGEYTYLIEEIGAFQSNGDGKALEDELEQIRRELNGDGTPEE